MCFLKKKILQYINGENKIIFTDYKKSYSVEEFKQRVNFFLTNIKKNIDYQDSKGIAIILPRDVNYFACIFACWILKCYFVPMREDMIKSEKNYQIKVSESCLIIKRLKNKIIFKKIKNNTKNVNNKENLSYIIFTSGSTGPRKGIKITYENFEAYFKSISKVFIKKKIKYNSLLINGEITFDIIQADLVFALLFKAEICLTENPKNFFHLFDLMTRRKVEAIYSVPSTWEKIIYLIESRKIKINFLKYLNSGGELLNINLINKMRKYFPRAKITNFYGPTEFTVNATFLEIEQKLIKSKKIIDEYGNLSIGKPLPNTKVKILKKNSSDQYGELLLSGPQIMKGYINSKKNFKIKIKKKYFYPTGDLVSIKHGFIFYKGRNKDYVKLDGYRINLDNISNSLSKLFQKKTIVILKNKSLVAYIETHKKFKINSAILKKKFEFWEIPSEFLFLKEFPKLDSGKIAKNYL
jgi:D-alanine--poly(phosphoribitol) ligase subunit 1